MKTRMHRAAFGKVGVAVVILALLGLFAMTVIRNAQQLRTEQDAVATQETLEKVADPLAALCAADVVVRERVGDEVCFAAQQAAETPPLTPAAGPTGDAGPPGRGITATVIRGDGHLLVSYSDGSRIDAGPVVGQEGPSGRGISESEVADGALIIRYTDGTSQNLGQVLGAKGADGQPGRGIASTAIREGRLIVTYTDGDSEDAGPVPAGPAGRDAELPTSYTNTFSDGTAQTCTRDGGENSAPVYHCGDRA